MTMPTPPTTPPETVDQPPTLAEIDAKLDAILQAMHIPDPTDNAASAPANPVAQPLPTATAAPLRAKLSPSLGARFGG